MLAAILSQTGRVCVCARVCSVCVCMCRVCVCVCVCVVEWGAGSDPITDWPCVCVCLSACLSVCVGVVCVCVCEGGVGRRLLGDTGPALWLQRPQMIVAQTNLLRNQVTLASNLARAGAFWSVVLSLVLGGAGCPSAQPHRGVGEGSTLSPVGRQGCFQMSLLGDLLLQRAEVKGRMWMGAGAPVNLGWPISVLAPGPLVIPAPTLKS